MYQASVSESVARTGKAQVRILGGAAPLWAPQAVPILDSSGTPLWVLAAGHLPDGNLTQTQILSFGYTASCCNDDIGIGQVCAAQVRLTVSGALNLLNAAIYPQIGVETENGIQWLPLGAFVVTECSRGDDVTQITALDAAFYALGGNYVPRVSSGATVRQVLADLLSQCGLEAEAATMNLGLGIPVNGNLTGHSCREMLGYLAALCGKNAVITRDGFVRFVWFTQTQQSVTPEDYYAGELSNGGVSRLSGLRCAVPGAEEDQVLLVGDDTKAVEISCPFMTQNQLEAIWYALGGYEYPVGSVSFHGGVLMEPGDIVSLTSRERVTISFPVMQVQLSVDGGCRCSITSSGQGETVRSNTVPGQLWGRLARAQNTASRAMLSANGKNKVFHQASAPAASEGLTAGDIWFNTALDNQISTWTGSQWSAFQLGEDAIEDLSITNAKIKDATIHSAKIAGLDAGKITSGTISADRIGANSIDASKINVTSLFSHDITATGGFSVHNANYALEAVQSSVVFSSKGGMGIYGEQVTVSAENGSCSIYGDLITIGDEDSTVVIEGFLTVEKKSTTSAIPGTSAASGSLNVAKSGYTPIGVLGFSFTDTNSSFVSMNRSYIEGTTYHWSARCIHVDGYSGNLDVYVLYMANNGAEE